MKTLLLTLVLAIGIFFKAEASHIIGAEMHYEYLGNDSFEVSLKLYRDCSSSVDYDDSTYFAVYDSLENLYNGYYANFNGSDTLLNRANNSCLLAPPNLCAEVTVYKFRAKFPVRPGGYNVVWGRCCRNGIIGNITKPDNTGASVYLHIPTDIINTDPIFTDYPPTLICPGYPYFLNNSAFDADGDSLVYSLSAPLSGSDMNIALPIPPAPPSELDSVVYKTGYSSQNPMGPGAVIINRHTGLMTIDAITLGQFLVCVKVQEYRNGRLLNTHTRDFQFAVVPCDLSTVVASYTALDTALTVTFSSSGSINGVKYDWTFGDGNTSKEANPVHQYATDGIYKVCLKVTNADSCFSIVCQNVTVGNVKRKCNANFSLFPNTAAQHSWTLLDASTGKLPITYEWNWGDGNISTEPAPSHTYDSEGFYSICLKITDDTLCTSTLCNSSVFLFRADASMVTVNVINPTSSIQGVSHSGLVVKAFPNPAENSITFMASERIVNGNVTIYDVVGRAVNASPFNGKEATMDITNLAQGMYTATINVQGSLSVVKFIKQ